MLAYIKGNLEMKMTDYVVIDVGGLGYKVYMSAIGLMAQVIKFLCHKIILIQLENYIIS